MNKYPLQLPDGRLIHTTHKMTVVPADTPVALTDGTVVGRVTEMEPFMHGEQIFCTKRVYDIMIEMILKDMNDARPN